MYKCIYMYRTAHWLAQSATANGPAILDKAFGESGPTAFAKWSGGQFQ